MTGAVVLLAAVVLLVLPIVEPVYSQQQMDHAMTVIGAPPGFLPVVPVPPAEGPKGDFLTEGGAFGAPIQQYIDYDDNEYLPDRDAVYTWYVNRLTALGFPNINPTSAYCHDFEVDFSLSDDLANGEPQVQVTASSQGFFNTFGSCPAGLFS